MDGSQAAQADRLQRLASGEQDAPTAAQASEIIMALYHDPARAVEANSWLVAFQDSAAPWELAPQLLQAEAEEVRFFAANALSKKCRTDMAQVPAESRLSLLSQLLAMAGASAQGPVCGRLCLAVAATIVSASEAQGLAGLLNHANFAALPKVLMLEILSYIPGEVNDSALSSRQRDAFIASLHEALPTVFSFVSQEATVKDEATLKQVVAVAEGWASVEHTGLSTAVLATNFPAVYTLLFRLVQSNSSLASAASAALCSTFEGTKRSELSQPGCFAELGAAVLGCRARYDAALAEGDEEVCAEYARLCAALASRGLLLMLKGEGGAVGEGLLQSLLVALQHPSIHVAEIAYLFWEKLPDATMEVAQVPAELNGPLHSQLVGAALTRAALPNGFTRWGEELQGAGGDDGPEEDEFGSLRLRLKDILQHCASMLGPAATLEAFAAILMPDAVASPRPVPWEVAEAVLFGYASVAVMLQIHRFEEQLQAASEHLVRLMGWILGPGVELLAAQPVAQQTACQVVGAYAAWLAESRPDLAHTVLQWLIPQLGAESAVTSTSAAQCFCFVTTKCQHLLASSPATLIELIGAAHGDAIVARGVAVRKPIAEGLSRTVSLLRPEDESMAISALMSVLTSRLGEAAGSLQTQDAAMLVQQPQFVEAVSAELIVLGETLRFLEGDASAGASHPAIVAVSGLWASVSALVSAVGAADAVAEAFATNVCASLFGAAKEALKPMLAEILQLLAQSFAASHGNSGCPKAVGTALEVYGKSSPDLAGGFTDLIGSISTVTFDLVRTDVGARPSLVTGYFTMLHRATIFCPEAVVGSPALSDVLQLIVVCLSLRDASICGQLFATLLKLVQSSAGDARLLAVLADQGILWPVVAAVLFAIADSAPQHQLLKLADVLQVRTLVLVCCSAVLLQADYDGSATCFSVSAGRAVSSRRAGTAGAVSGSAAGCVQRAQERQLPLQQRRSGRGRSAADSPPREVPGPADADGPQRPTLPVRRPLARHLRLLRAAPTLTLRLCVLPQPVCAGLLEDLQGRADHRRSRGIRRRVTII